MPARQAPPPTQIIGWLAFGDGSSLYRKAHAQHHRDEFGPGEPDLNLYNGYPITGASMRRKLWRDARGSSGWKNLKGLLLAVRARSRFAARRRKSHASAVRGEARP